MRNLLSILFVLIALPVFGAVPAYTSFRGTGGILITSNPPVGNITIDGSGIFTSSGTNATIAISTNGVLVMVAATNVNFVIGSNVFLAATNIGSSAHIGINAFTPVPFIQGSVSNFLLTYILPVLTVDTLTVSNLLSAPPWSSVQFNSNGVTRGSAGFIYTNGQVRVADVVIAGQGVEVTAGSFVLNGGDTALVAWNGLGRMRWPTGGVARLEDDFASSFNRIQLGGDTAAFPAIGRTNGDVIILGANGAFKLGGSTNRLIAPAVHIANDGGPGTTLLSLHNPLSEIRWDMAIDSNPETYFLGLRRASDATYTMVWELTSGNVGIGITNPTVRLDVQGRFMARSNVYFPNLLSNALPVAFLATDSQGEVYETAVPTGGGGSAAGDSGAIQFNQSGAFAGTNTLVFDRTNNRVGIGIASPLYTLDVQASSGIQRLVSTTAANEALLLFVNDSAALIGLESGVPGTTVAGSSAHSLLLANQYAYPVQLATDNSVRMTVLPTSGNVGIATASPTNTFDVNGHASIRSNLFLANLPTNGSPIAFLATDAAGVVYETAVPTGGSSSSETNVVLTNLVGTVANNVTNVVSLSTSNATSKPLTNSYTAGVLTLFGLEAGANVTVTPNGSNLVIAATGGGSSVAPPISSVQFNSNGVLQGSERFIYTNGQVAIGTNFTTSTFHIRPTQHGASTLRVDDTNGTPRFQVGVYPAAPQFAGVWLGNITPDGGNYALLKEGNNLYVNASPSGAINFQIGGNGAWNINSFGHFVAAADNTFDIGAIASTRPRHLNVASNGLFGGSVAIGTNQSIAMLDVVGGIRSHTVTASRMAAFHTDKTLTNGATTVALLDNFFAIGITNIVAAGANIVIRTNNGTLTVSNAMASGGAAFSGHSHAIPYINGAGTALTYYDPGNALTNPGFGFNPVSAVLPHGYGGLLVFANEPMGFVTIGPPSLSSYFETYAPSLVISNRFGGAADFKQEMIRVDAFLDGTGLSSTSSLMSWRTWSGTTPTIVAEITKVGIKVGPSGGVLTNTLYATATLNFPSTVAGTVSDLKIDLVGAADGDIVALGEPSGSIGPLTGVYNAWASNDVVYVRFANNDLVTAQDPASGVFKVRVDKFQ